MCKYMYGIFPSQFRKLYHYIIECNDVFLHRATQAAACVVYPSQCFVIKWNVLIYELHIKFREVFRGVALYLQYIHPSCCVA